MKLEQLIFSILFFNYSWYLGQFLRICLTYYSELFLYLDLSFPFSFAFLVPVISLAYGYFSLKKNRLLFEFRRFFTFFPRKAQ